MSPRTQLYLQVYWRLLCAIFFLYDFQVCNCTRWETISVPPAKYVLAEEEGKLRVIIVMRQLRFTDHTLHTVEYHMVLTSQQAKLGW